MMYRYSKYIISNQAMATLFIAAGLTCIIWLTQSLRFVDLIVNRGLDTLAFVYLTTMLLPSLLGFMLPIAAAIGIIYTYHRLQNESELVILKSAGLSSWQLAKPALTFCLLVVAIGYSISLYLLPISYRQYSDMQAYARNNYVSLLLQEGVFNSPVDNLTVFIRERDASGNLRGIMVQDNRDPKRAITMLAEEGQLVNTPKGPSFILKRGDRQERDSKTGRLSFLGFDDYVLDISLFTKDQTVRQRDAKERFLKELLFPENTIKPTERAEFLTEAHQRLTWPLHNMSLPLFVLAMLLNARFNRRGNWKLYTTTLIGVGITLALVIGVSNFSVKHPECIVLMYLIPASVMFISFYSLARPPSEPFVPKENPHPEIGQ